MEVLRGEKTLTFIVHTLLNKESGAGVIGVQSSGELISKAPEEYAAARGSTLNAHYTSPVVIKAIYEAVGKNILLPIGYIQHHPPIHKKKSVNKYTAAGRAEIHKNLESVDMTTLNIRRSQYG